MSYPNTQLLIAGQWQDATDGRTLPVFNPASCEVTCMSVCTYPARRRMTSRTTRSRIAFTACSTNMGAAFLPSTE